METLTVSPSLQKSMFSSLIFVLFTTSLKRQIYILGFSPRPSDLILVVAGLKSFISSHFWSLAIIEEAVWGKEGKLAIRLDIEAIVS